MNSFTRANLSALRKDIDAALAVVSAKHDLIISLGNCRFTATEAKFAKLNILPKTLPSQSVSTNSADPFNTLESREYLNLAYMFALPKDGLGRKFKVIGGTVYTVIGLKASRHKYPVIGIGPAGGRYKFTAEQVKKGLI